MNIVKLIKDAQTGSRKNKEISIKELFDYYKDYFLKRFKLHSPYLTENDNVEFASKLGGKLLYLIENKIRNFKLKDFYTDKEADHHIWHYFRTIADSILDRELLILSVHAINSEIKLKASEILKSKYYDFIHDNLFNLLNNIETGVTKNLKGFELEDYIEKETLKLTQDFIGKKFEKISKYFNKKKTAIFRNYLESSVNNFFIDYIRKVNVQKMRRLVIYRQDLPEELFEHLRKLKGYGHLFYYKKRYDSLSIRDTGKALSVIKSLNLPDSAFVQIKHIFKLSNKRAEYQRIIDNITDYIKNYCPDEKCRDGLNPKSIKVLLYINDYVMYKALKLTERHIEKAKKKLKNCIDCLKIKVNVFSKY